MQGLLGTHRVKLKVYGLKDRRRLSAEKTQSILYEDLTMQIRKENNFFLLLYPSLPVRQAGHKSLSQLTVEERSSRKYCFSLKSKSDVFLIILICSLVNSCQILG